MKARYVSLIVLPALLIVVARLFRDEPHLDDQTVSLSEPSQAPARDPREHRVPIHDRMIAPDHTEPKHSSRISGAPSKSVELHQRYASILAQLGLAPVQVDRFVELRIRILGAHSDLNTAADEADARGGSSGIEKLRDEITKPMWDEIRLLFRDTDRFTAFREFDQMLGFRPMMGAMFKTARVPISDQTIEVVARVALRRSVTGLENPTNFYAWQQVDWIGTILDAESLLTPAQLAVIHQYAAQVAARKGRG